MLRPNLLGGDVGNEVFPETGCRRLQQVQIGQGMGGQGSGEVLAQPSGIGNVTIPVSPGVL